MNKPDREEEEIFEEEELLDDGFLVAVDMLLPDRPEWELDEVIEEAQLYAYSVGG